MESNKNIPAMNQESFPTYNRAGRLRSGSYNGAPFSKVLASFRSASEIPIPEPIKGSPTPEKPMLTPVSQIEPLPQDRGHSELSMPLSPKNIDESTRNQLENRVRTRKRQREKCPFTGINGECCRPDIRCGERVQFSGRESDKQQNMPHRCLYTPYFSSDNVIIVESDPLQREFMLNSFKLFLNYDMEKIATIQTGDAATEMLTRYKLQNRMIGLVVVNCSSLGTGVYRFLTELYERNINAEIILTGTGSDEEMQLVNEFRKKEVSSGVSFISEYLELPVHTEKFISAVSTLHFGRFL